MMVSEQSTANLMALAVCLLLVGSSCHEADSSAGMGSAESREAKPEGVEFSKREVGDGGANGRAASTEIAPATRPDRPTAQELLARLPAHRAPPWLVVWAAKKATPGGWATASFDAKRNRITIDTTDVEAFSIDTSRIAIRWDRLVIVRIDGRNAELVRRKNPVIRFERDAHRQWVAAGP